MGRERNQAAGALIDPGIAHSFFDWLAPQLERVFDSAEVRSHVTKQLRAVSADVVWEAGPWNDGKSFFAISPNMNIDAVPVARRIVELAPSVPGWEFLSAKPRKHWRRKIRWKSGDGAERIIDLSDWEYWLTKFNNGEFFDVNLVPGGTALSARDLHRLGEVLAASELGEAVFLSHVGRVNIVPRKDVVVGVSPIEYLHDQFMDQLNARFQH
jgi:hypothetical protein